MSNIAIFPGSTFNLITGATTIGAAISPSFYTQVDSSGGVVVNVTSTQVGPFSSLQFAIDGSTADSGSTPTQLTIWDAITSPSISLILTPGLFYRLRAISFTGGTSVSVSAIINVAAMALPATGGGSTVDVQYSDGATQAAPTGTVALGKNPSNVLHAVALDASGNTIVSGTVTANVGTGTQPVSGSVSVSNFPATQPVSGSVSVSNFPATQPVSLATAPTTPVTGTFFQTTQPVSLATLPALTAGAAVIGTVNIAAAQTIAATESGTWTVQPGNTANTTPWLVSTTPDILGVTATGAAAAAVTLTLPAVASQFHYISHIEITKYCTLAITGTATPVLVTTTNLAGNPVFTFDTAQAIGTSLNRNYEPSSELRSAVVNTATTIVCPATTNVIWRVNVWYRAGV